MIFVLCKNEHLILEFSFEMQRSGLYTQQSYDDSGCLTGREQIVACCKLLSQYMPPRREDRLHSWSEDRGSKLGQPEHEASNRDVLRFTASSRAMSRFLYPFLFPRK